jgi:membrane-bound lytic murein transglycosylase B
MGLMQLMPATWREARLALGLGSDPHDPADNILAGAWYLRRMYDRFGYPGLFGAYNAGPGRYAAYLAGRSTLPRETQNYLARVAGDEAAAGKPAAAALPTRGLFFSLGEAAPPDLFVVRKVAATVGPSAAVPNAQKPER